MTPDDRPVRSRRLLPRLVFALLLLAAAAWAVLSWTSRHPIRDLLPGGALVAAELRDLEEIFDRLEGTAFAREFARSRLAAWLEETGPIPALDDLRARISLATGIKLRRDHLLDLVGSETAVAWYPIAGSNSRAALPWVAGCRLSLRAWGIVSFLHLADRMGLGGLPLTRERAAGQKIFGLHGEGPGTQYHAFIIGRLMLVGSDRDLLLRAARCADGRETPLTRDPAWDAVRPRLSPEDGLLLVGNLALLPVGLIPGGGGRPRIAAVTVRPGRETEIRVFEAREESPSGSRPAASKASFPGMGELARNPLLLYSRRGSPPAPVGDWLADRASAVARRDGRTVPALPAPGEGFGLVVTESVDGGPFPRPRGLVLIGMKSPEDAAAVLRDLFPRGSRTADLGGLQAFSTRESLPLAGAFELWGAAAGRQLVLATDAAILDGLSPGEDGGDSADGPDPARPLDDGWRMDAFSSVSMAKALPLLRRYAPPLTGWLRARFPGAPDLGRDFDLLRAIRFITVAEGSLPGGSLTSITFTLADL